MDPGPEKSACLVYNSVSKQIDWSKTGILDNQSLKHCLYGEYGRGLGFVDIFVIESIRSFMMRVGRDVFDTVRWEGIFAEAINRCCEKDVVIFVARKTVVAHICGLAKGNDADIRAALIDRFPATGKDGKDNPSAIGTKKYPGPLHGVKKDLWSALAVAVYYAEQQEKKDA